MSRREIAAGGFASSSRTNRRRARGAPGYGVKVKNTQLLSGEQPALLQARDFQA
jgi:hypothetical protein